MTKHRLQIVNLTVAVADRIILKNLSLEVVSGQVHAIMGPNGSGKSTLSATLFGHPAYRVVEGRIILDGQDIVNMTTDKRARMGLFLAFQYPLAIPGVSVANFLRTAYNSVHQTKISPREFLELVKKEMDLFKIDHSFISRSLNDGFSGGEKKKFEVLQLSILRPKMMILDETDSGLDVDALKIVAGRIRKILKPKRQAPGVLVITHYQRMLDYIKPDVIHVMIDGRIVRSGDQRLVKMVERRGYDWVSQRFS